MIKGEVIENFLTTDELYSRTSGGYDIYMYYLGKVERQMNRPWGHKEKKASWGIFFKNNLWRWKDQATEESGTAIQFVQKYFNLSFAEAMQKVCFDFGVGGKETNVAPVKITWEKPDKEKEEEYVHIGITKKPFTKKHHEFWNCVEVSEEWCKKFNCFAARDIAINRKRVNIRPNEIVFFYEATDIKSYKIYFPEREQSKKFRNNVPYHYLWNYNNIQECENLIVSKSNKDMIVTSLLFPCIIATQAEAIKIFNEEVVEKINKITKKPWVWYGSDWDGVKKCKEITDTNKWKYINTPKDLLPEINDPYGFVKKFGLQKLEEFMKLKKLLK